MRRLQWSCMYYAGTRSMHRETVCYGREPAPAFDLAFQQQRTAMMLMGDPRRSTGAGG